MSLTIETGYAKANETMHQLFDSILSSLTEEDRKDPEIRVLLAELNTHFRDAMYRVGDILSRASRNAVAPKEG
jgi:hypothetical protein